MPRRSLAFIEASSLSLRLVVVYPVIYSRRQKVFYFDSSHDYSHYTRMKTISKSRLKAKMLSCFREIEATGEPLIVTDNGREVLEVRPYRNAKPSTVDILSAYRSADSGKLKLPAEKELLMPEPTADWAALNEENETRW